jgi:peptidoglycan/LPS O-acetylase OafA/YrhL
MTPRSQAAGRFATLDLLRGLAALAILSRHYDWPVAGMMHFLPRSYLAVDLFFVLSGFVLAHAYGERLREGFGLGRFLRARLIRLYPLYALATVVVALLLLASRVRRGLELSSWAPALALSLGFAPIPPGWSISTGDLYPFVGVGWSLLWELAVNLLFAAIALRLSRRALAILIAAGLAAIAIAASWYGSLDFGVAWAGAWVGAGRALFGFFAGVAVYRVHRARPAIGVRPWLLALVLLAALTWEPARGGGLLDLGIVVAVFPPLVWLAASADEGPRSSAVGIALGRLSYPLYLMQTPVQALMVPALKYGFAGSFAAAPWTWFAVYCAVSIAVAWVTAVWFDEPVRAWLSRRFRAPQVTAAQSAP